MARYAYDVNTTQRYIDVHKQFQGGLKTVDTDDSLGAVFLRQAENISLSEFGFVEKRYGTYEKFKRFIPGNFQGYWEFKGFNIFAVEGKIYYSKLVNGKFDTFTEVKEFNKEFENLRYPELSDIPDVTFIVTPQCSFTQSSQKLDFYSPSSPIQSPDTPEPACARGAVYYSGCEDLGNEQWRCYVNVADYSETISIDTPFQTTRDMNGISLNDTFYLFTGSYPIYAKQVNEQLSFYLMPITVPNQDEIIVTGHNLLEYDFEEAYRFGGQTIVNQGSPQETFIQEGFNIKESGFSPLYPYAKDGYLDLQFNYEIGSKFANPFILSNSDRHLLNVINLEGIGYRNSGPGASALDYNAVDITKTNFKTISNYEGNVDLFIAGEDPETKLIPIAQDLITEQTTEKRIRYSGTQVEDLVVFYKDTVQIPQRLALVDSVPGTSYTFKLFKQNNDFSIEQINITEDIAGEPGIGGIKLSAIEEPFYFANQEYGGKTEQELFKMSAKIEITPYTEFDEEFKVNKFTIDNVDISRNDFKFSVPDSLITEKVSYYIFNLIITYEYVVKKTRSIGTITGISAIRPLKEVFANIEDSTIPTPIIASFLKDIKVPATPEQRLSSLNIPSLNFRLTDLIPGNYDFNVSFLMQQYEYDQNTNSLIPIGTKRAETTLYAVNITELKYEDYPTGEPNVLPTLKPIWTCNKVIEHFGKLMVWGSKQMPSSVFYSFPDVPYYFPSKFYLDFFNDEGSAVQNVTPYMNILVVQTEDRTWGVRGNSGLIDAPAPYIPFTINPTVGTIAYKSVRPVRNHLFFLSKQGIIALKSLYAADEQYNIEFVDRNIRNIVPQDSKAVGIQFDNQYWLNFPNFGITLRWYIDKKGWVQDIFGAWNQFNGVLKWQIKDGKLEFISYPSRFKLGENLAIYNVGIDYELPTDLTEPITAKFETSFLNQNYPFHPKNYKEAKFDFTLQNEYNLGREAIYQMDTNEDIVGSFHTIQDGLLKNHRYRIEYDFSETETLLYDGGLYETAIFDTLIDGNLDAPGIDCRFYTIVEYIQKGNDFLDLVGVDYTTVEFVLPNYTTLADLIIKGDFTGYQGGAYLRDVTYDDSLVFKAWVISEDRTLNIDNFEGYDPELVNVGLDLKLKDRLGDWLFGESDFGNKVTAVKTVKLSGKGYNSKVYIEDLSKSKWTMESLGITYKMKRARSR